MLLRYKRAGLKQSAMQLGPWGAHPKHHPTESVTESCQFLMHWLYIEGDLHIDMHSREPSAVGKDDSVA